MKKQIPYLSILILLAGIFLLNSSCKKKNSDPSPATNNSPVTGALFFHLHNNIDNTEIENYDTIYTDSTGRKYALTMGQTFLSNIRLIHLDGSEYLIKNVVVLKTEENESFFVANVPVGNYRTVRFDVGLDSTTNKSNPDSATSPLNTPNMWFGQAPQPQGYVFANFQGKIDTTASATGTPESMQPFKYLIGTNNNLKEVTMPDQTVSILEGQASYIHMVIDYRQLFHGVAINQKTNLLVQTPADNATSLGKAIANNIPAMFRYEVEDMIMRLGDAQPTGH